MYEVTYTGSSSSSEDQTTEVSSALVAQGASSVDEGTNTIALKGGTDERGTPGNGSAVGLLGLEELLLGVSALGALVSGAEQRRQDGELNTVVEDGAESNSRGLDGREIYWAASMVSQMRILQPGERQS